MKTIQLVIFLVLSVITQSVYAKDHTYASQYEVSIRSLLENFQKNGAIIASPSRHDPNYYYDWVRDSSLTMKAVVDVAFDKKTAVSLRKNLFDRIETWIAWELHRQIVPNKQTDLGEPRFNLDGTPNQEPWGRPQNDGPALRAITAIKIANEWIKLGKLEEVKQRLYSARLPANTLIKRDLEYVAHHWNESSFDLWEEERGMHFYTLTAHKVALISGAKLAARMDDDGAARFYKEQAQRIESTLKLFIDPNSGVIKYAIKKDSPLRHKTSDLDISVILAAIQTFDGKFYVPVPEAYKTLSALHEKFKEIYPINSKVSAKLKKLDLGVALGRYPQDIYNGSGFGEGNAWFISTLASAQFLCQLIKVNYLPKHSEKLKELALRQFNRALFHLDARGGMAEQFNRHTGIQQGARDLTWSYSAYVTAYRECF